MESSNSRSIIGSAGSPAGAGVVPRLKKRGPTQYRSLSSTGRCDRQDFRITFGLAEGYDMRSNPVTTPHKAKSLIAGWLRDRRLAKLPYQSGFLCFGNMIYVPRKQSRGKGVVEPTATYSGTISPIFRDSGCFRLSNQAVLEMLTSLADHLGRNLGQNRVYIEYGAWLIIREKISDE
jgi:hypothetical protein